MEQNIPFEIIHVGIIESTIPLSEKMIDEGKKENFLLNADEQTAGRGSGNRKWVSQKGNALTTLNIHEKYLLKSIENLKLSPFIIAVSICENLNKISKDKFCIKWPNDILCKDKFKVCGILVDKYKEFYQLSFGINLIQSPDSSEIREGGRTACNLSKHSDNIPNPLDFSKLLCEDICKKLISYSCKQIIEEWKSYCDFNIMFTKRDDTSGKLYKPIDITLEGKIRASDPKGNEETIDPQFPFIKKI